MRISDWSSDVCSSDLLDKLAQNVDDLAVEKVEGIADGEQPNHPPCGASIGGRTERCLRFDRHAAHRAGDRAPDHRRSPRAGPAAPAAARKIMSNSRKLALPRAFEDIDRAMTIDTGIFGCNTTPSR